MRELKKELANNKKLYEGLAALKKQYEKGAIDAEKQKRINQVDRLIETYKSLNAYTKNPSAGLINFRDEESKL